MFIYTNVNPFNADMKDCVCRAISLATDIDYFIIQEKLLLTAMLFDCDALSPCCYSHLLEDVFDCEPVYCKGMTLADFADENPFGSFVVRIPNHLTAVVNGDIFDTFDCSNEVCDLAWQVFETFS